MIPEERDSLNEFQSVNHVPEDAGEKGHVSE